MSEVQFSKNVSKAAKIADRAGSELINRSGGRMSFIMDLCAADGVNGNDPIDFDRLAQADDFNFFHDVAGIQRHLNRDTGKLENCFRPRFVRASQA